MTNTVNCVFCKIIAGDMPGEILYQDSDVVVIEDIKPAARHHYLAIPREHIDNVNKLSTLGHTTLVGKLVECGKKSIGENGGDLNDIRIGFHCPPFNSISHLHLHIISPASQMNFFSRLVFKPNTWWFQAVEEVLVKLSKE